MNEISARKMLSEKSRSQRVADILRSKIKAGDLAPGERLASIRSLAAEFGVGRQVVLSAFNILSEENLISGEVGRGTFVNGLAGNSLDGGKLRIAYVIVRGELDAKFDSLIAGGLRRTAEKAGHKFTVHENVNEKDMPSICKNCDCVVIGGRVTNTFIGKMLKLGTKFISVGNRSLAPESNNIRFNIAPLLKKMLESDKSATKTVGMITGSIHLPSSHEHIALLEEYAFENGLRWDRACIVCTDSFYGAEEIEEMWGAENNWPERVIMTLHTYLGFAQFAAENRIPESAYPEILVIGADPQFMPLPYPKFKAQAYDTHETQFGEKLLDIVEALASDKINTPFSGGFDPRRCEIIINENKSIKDV